MLVQQIQMAVQAGHLNPQILNQPLAPQTLILLNQLLQQIKTLQTLQQNHTMAQANKSMTNSRELLSISVNITKTKQHITNLQNQISAQQANYLKSQNMPQQGKYYDLISVIILVVFGTLIGLIPANRATSIKPIDALREE